MRRLLPDEVEELAALEAELFPDNCFNENTLRRELKVSKCWVETRERELIGYVLARVEDDLVDILRLGVRSRHTRQGVATRLLLRASSEAPRAMLTVKKDNVPAVSLYFAYGFRIVAHLEDEGAWMMLRASGS